MGKVIEEEGDSLHGGQEGVRERGKEREREDEGKAAVKIHCRKIRKITPILNHSFGMSGLPSLFCLLMVQYIINPQWINVLITSESPDPVTYQKSAGNQTFNTRPVGDISDPNCNNIAEPPPLFLSLLILSFSLNHQIFDLDLFFLRR